MVSTLCAQTVIFGDDETSLFNSVQSFSGALQIARRAGLEGTVVFAHGDASPTALSSETINLLTSVGRDGGFDYHYTFFDSNTGSARGQNLLADAWPSTWHFVTNPNVIFGGTSLMHLWQISQDATIGIAEARQLPLELAKYYNSQTGDTSWGSGACSFIRGQLWREIAGYDDKTFFLHGDDVDMSWRIRLRGYRVVHVPQARIFHDKRLSNTDVSPMVPDHERFYSALCSYMMALKWGTDSQLAIVNRHLSGPEYDDVRIEIARRFDAGEIPTRVLGAEMVAQFDERGNYGLWRF